MCQRAALIDAFLRPQSLLTRTALQAKLALTLTNEK